jgi:hypothetical protein
MTKKRVPVAPRKVWLVIDDAARPYGEPATKQRDAKRMASAANEATGNRVGYRVAGPYVLAERIGQ